MLKRSDASPARPSGSAVVADQPSPRSWSRSGSSCRCRARSRRPSARAGDACPATSRAAPGRGLEEKLHPAAAGNEEAATGSPDPVKGERGLRLEQDPEHHDAGKVAQPEQLLERLPLVGEETSLLPSPAAARRAGQDMLASRPARAVRSGSGASGRSTADDLCRGAGAGRTARPGRCRRAQLPGADAVPAATRTATPSRLHRGRPRSPSWVPNERWGRVPRG